MTEISDALKALRAGDVIGAATETVYGLMVDAANPEAIAKLYAVKGRGAQQPMQILFHTLAMAEPLVQWTDGARCIAETFWPGGLTLILPRNPHPWMHPDAVGGGDTAGLRWPNAPHLQELIAAFGRPIAASSANYAKEPPASSAEEVRRLGVDCVVQGVQAVSGVASTVAKLEGDRLTLLREGTITQAELEKVLRSAKN